MNDYESRLMIEFEDLLKKILKLKEFILSAKYENLPEVDKKDLKEQLEYMEKYCAVLSRRTSRCCNSA